MKIALMPVKSSCLVSKASDALPGVFFSWTLDRQTVLGPQCILQLPRTPRYSCSVSMPTAESLGVWHGQWYFLKGPWLIRTYGRVQTRWCRLKGLRLRNNLWYIFTVVLLGKQDQTESKWWGPASALGSKPYSWQKLKGALCIQDFCRKSSK